MNIDIDEKDQPSTDPSVQTAPAAMLRIRGLEVVYSGRRRRSRPAVSDIDLDVRAGSTTALVGESGSGKSTIAKTIVGLQRPSAGSIELDGESVIAPNGAFRRPVLDRISMIFQDPVSSLNPSKTVGATLLESLGRRTKGASRDALRDRLASQLAEVGLDASAVSKYPVHFSGGQRQRIAIARALIREPQLIICDEPTSALDLSVQAQILNLLLELQASRSVAYLFISHDMAVVEHISDDIAVISGGRIVERGSVAEVLDAPTHPYTQRLLAAVPQPIAPRGDDTPPPASRGGSI